MATTRIRTMESPVLTQHVLTPEQRDAELYLAEDDDFIYLKSRKNPDLCMVFSAYGATSDQIRREAEKELLR